MNSRRAIGAAVLLCLTGMLGQASVLSAEDVTVLCSNGLKAVVEDLVPKFERATKNKVVVKYGLAASLKQRIEGGEAFDVAFLTPGPIDDLIKQGKIAADSRMTIAKSGLAIAIKSGAPKHDLRTVDAFKRALLDAKGIAYAKEGASGVAFTALIQKLGITEALKAKSKPTATGEEVAEAIVKGESEFGVLPVSEILPIRGAEMLGPFPPELQSYIVMVGGMSAAARSAGAGKALIAYVMAPEALPVIKAKGMER